ncbi:unnamed protein product [Brachionus calyciflorus]|uniref:Uncharacterized protein n=1 Tax=Brachionus calyciflorus TaxID=104777 RepID=A0A814IKI1_9BILA|nr:unnamed protein product [Brachionus calyciflorus]
MAPNAKVEASVESLKVLPRFKDIFKKTTSSSLIESKIIQVIVSDSIYATSSVEKSKQNEKVQSSTRSSFGNKNIEEKTKNNGHYPVSDFESITNSNVLRTSTLNRQISDNFTPQFNQLIVNLINSNSFHDNFSRKKATSPFVYTETTGSIFKNNSNNLKLDYEDDSRNNNLLFGFLFFFIVFVVVIVVLLLKKKVILLNVAFALR